VENLIGSPGVDDLKGTSGENVISGGGGADTIAGLDGPDNYQFLQGAWGDETITEISSDEDNSAAIDRLDFSRVSDDLTFTLRADGSVSVTDGTHAIDTRDTSDPDKVVIADVEALIGGSGNNTFVFEMGADFSGTIDGGCR